MATFFDIPDYTDTSIQIRLSLLKLSSLAGSSVSPWAGSGTGTAEGRLEEVASVQGISNSLGSFDPHNQLIYTFLDLGLAGLLCLIAVFVVPLREAWKTKSIPCTGIILVFFAVCLTESAFELQKGIIFFTFFGSLLLFHEMTSPQRREQRD